MLGGVCWLGGTHHRQMSLSNMGLNTKYMTEEPLSGEPGIHRPTVLLPEAKLLELAGTA